MFNLILGFEMDPYRETGQVVGYGLSAMGVVTALKQLRVKFPAKSAAPVIVCENGVCPAVESFTSDSKLFGVPNTNCESCTSTIRKALENAGVSNFRFTPIEVRTEAGKQVKHSQILVEDARFNAEQIREIIGNVGFEATQIILK